MNRETEEQTLRKARPYMVLVIALLLRLRYTTYTSAQCFSSATEFLRSWEATK